MKLLAAAVGFLIFVILWQTGVTPMWLDQFGLMPDHGTYFRLKVKVAYKGQPQDFDIVVGCNINVSPNEGGSSPTYEVGLVPTLFGKRMSDGTALVVRPPNACGGQTSANGQVPSEFIPLIIVYDDADTLGFGTAYLTEDAYHNTLSVLTFGGATIETATRAEFKSFRASQKNVVTPATYFSSSPPELRKRHLEQPAVMFGGICHGYARYRLIDEPRAAAERYLPQNHPAYWRPTTQAHLDAIYGESPIAQIVETDDPSAQRHTLLAFRYGVEPDAADFGVPTHTGNGLIRRRSVYPASLYPDFGAWIRRPAPRALAAEAVAIIENGPRVGASIDFRGGRTKGFAYCWWDPAWYVAREPSMAGPEPPELRKYYSQWSTDFIDETEVAGAEHKDRSPLIVEGTDYFLELFTVFLNSTRGDV